MAITITQVVTKTQKRKFYEFAWRIYHNDPHWVPPLWAQRKEYLDKTAAFFTFGEGDFWLVYDGDKLIGTLGTAVDHSFNHEKGRKAAEFGFFEVLPDRYDAASAMWDFARKWAKSRGMDELLGPLSFTGSEDHGFLVGGFDTLPAIMMGHNPPYYAQFAERYGFQPVAEDVAYRFDLEQIGFDLSRAPGPFFKIAGRVKQRHGGQVIRNPRMEDWDREVERLHPVYNKSLAVLPEFSPVELAEFRALALGLKDVLDPELVFIAELDGKEIGFSLGLPNLAEALHHANGLRLPWDYLRFLLDRRRITGVSFKILAMDPDYWGRGIESAMFIKMGEAVLRKGYTWVDGSLTNTLNPQTNKIAVRVGARVYRRYKDYALSL